MECRAAWLNLAGESGSRIARQASPNGWLVLTAEARGAHSSAVLQAAVEAMIADANGPIPKAEVIESATLEDWPEKRSGDPAVVAVALSGDGFSEAVSLTV